MEQKWEQIATELQAQLDKVKSEISQYPGPITGCDAQFNYLLEQRYALAGELARLRKIQNNVLQSDKGQVVLDDFLATSLCPSDS